MASHETQNLTEVFQNAAPQYEARMGTATRMAARRIASKLSLPPNSQVCDNACGTGAVTSAVLDVYPDAVISATDNSAGMISIMNNIAAQQGLGDRIKTQLADSAELGYADAIFDAQIMNFGIFFCPDELKVAQEIYRTLKPGGTAVITSWKDSAIFRILYEMQDIVKPAKPFEAMPTLKKWSSPETMVSVLQTAGFQHVDVEEYSVTSTAKTMEALLQGTSENLKSIVGTQWTDEEKDRIYDAAAQVLKNRGSEYLTVNEPDSKGIWWVCNIGTATK